MSLRATGNQTVGPYFSIGLSKLIVENVAGSGASGERVTIQGKVVDGDGQPVPDAMIETWQANAHGKYAHPEDTQDKPLEQGFKGFGRVATDKNGVFRFMTIKPGRVPGPAGALQAPHIGVAVFMRGLLIHLVTRIYFPDEASNGDDPVLKRVGKERQATLIARKTKEARVLEWNVVLQGADETVFFDA